MDLGHMLTRLAKDPKTWATLAVALLGILGAALWNWRYGVVVGVVLFIAVLSVAWWRWSAEQREAHQAATLAAMEQKNQQREAARQQFALCKSVRELVAEDFGYEVLDPGQQASQDRRPFYRRYVPRRIVPALAAGALDHRRTYTESELAHHLLQSESFVLLGQPLMGKSRTLYTVLSHLPDWLIIRPRKKGGIPPDDAFAEVISGQSVVLVLEELNDFAGGSAPDLEEFREAIWRAQPTRLAIAATCRDGSELSVVGNGVDSSLRRFYDDIPLKLELLPQTLGEKQLVAESAGRIDWDPTRADLFPTPGAITMEDALRYQRSRFVQLPGVQQDALRSLRLLTIGGVLPLTHDRLASVLSHVFDRTPPHFGELLDQLGQESFLRRPSRQDPLGPEPAYLGPAVVSYVEGREVASDFPALRDALVMADDVNGLYLLGATLGNLFKNHAESLVVFEAALRLRPDDPRTLTGKGIALLRLGRDAEALDTFERSLAVRPNHSDTLEGKGIALLRLCRDAEALDTFERSLALRPDDPDTLTNTVIALRRLHRTAEALEMFKRSLALRPEHLDTLTNKDIAHLRLGRHAETLDAAVKRSFTLRPIIPHH